MSESMRSWRFSYADAKFGNLHQERIAIPRPAEGQVLIRVHAASLNPIDIYRLIGRSAGPNHAVSRCIGFDFAGVVAGLHGDCSRFSLGQRVFGCVHESGGEIGGQGSLQEYVVVDSTRLVQMPRNLSYSEAAAMVVVGVTSIQAFDRANLQVGESVLITGGSGGVGTAAIQIAKRMFGAANVLTTIRSADRIAICHSLGCDAHFVTNNGRNTGGRVWPDDEPVPTVDVVLDCTNQGTALRRLFRTQNTRLVSISTFDDPDVDCFGANVGDSMSLARLVPFLESGVVIPVISKTFGFNQVYQVHNA